MRPGGDSRLAPAQPARAAAHVSAQPGLPLRCLHAGVLFASAEACMLLQRNMTHPVVLLTLMAHELWTGQCYWGRLLDLTCRMQQEPIHTEDDLLVFEVLKENIQDAQTHTEQTE